MGGDATVHYKDSQQSVISVSLQIAFICSGANYAQYERVLGSLVMHPVSDVIVAVGNVAR